jgi:hypothetical protein
VKTRTETQSIESAADPGAIVELLADPSHIPAWAPAFADAVIGDEPSGWQAIKGGQGFAFRVVTQREAGTVDYLREIAPGREGGAYLRVVPRPGGGSVVIMSVPLGSGAEPAAVTASLAGELRALVTLVESI